MVTIERTQTGMRIERSTLKVLKALAEYLDLSLGDLVEGIVLHAFEGQAPFSAAVLAKIEQLKAVYDLTLTAADVRPVRNASPSFARLACRHASTRMGLSHQS